jgi:Ni/Co efflux regulator RcnB
MKKFLLTLIVAAFAACPMVAQNANTAVQSHQVVKHECKDHKDGQACNKPADQQCNDCKAKAAAAHQCDKAEGMKKCDKAEGMKKCDKAEGMKKCANAEGMKKCDKAEGTKCQKTAAMKHECKDHKDGQACNKPADQQCNDCKAKAAAKKN